MKFTFHPEARAELNHSVDFYEARQAKLGLEFLEELYSTIQRIIEFPKAYSKQSKNTRRCLTNRFPFAVIYQIRPKKVGVYGEIGAILIEDKTHAVLGTTTKSEILQKAEALLGEEAQVA
ncbi:MAG TPA: type II toxin-antitoxin system RelE/ParE family toxin [bacterium]